MYSEFAASYPLIDCHTGLPLVWAIQGVKHRMIQKLYCYFAVKFGFVKKEEISQMWRFSRKYLFYRSYHQMDSIFKQNGFKVKDITYKRRFERFLSDGVGTIRELWNYKIHRKKGISKKIGFCVKCYLYFHAKSYRLLSNRVILLQKD
ncbi:hypothetical protein [Helicobacter sp.]|uniref:hypothetical protein n=1 Tax=Helicobacter sp. TaxID=218 RepID=UPI0019842CE3|nr:hypothetical protein [Helicobacter sp.]MBD5165448.1 hypothetical protein [Helicobacter sp.]